MSTEGSNSGLAPPGVSIRNGPVLDDTMDVDESLTNGNSKRKARNSTSKAVNYNTDGSEGDSDEDVPLVSQNIHLKR
jgi:DNA topoisomerase-1